jgi:hypothetical protein
LAGVEQKLEIQAHRLRAIANFWHSLGPLFPFNNRVALSNPLSVCRLILTVVNWALLLGIDNVDAVANNPKKVIALARVDMPVILLGRVNRRATLRRRRRTMV